MCDSPQILNNMSLFEEDMWKLVHICVELEEKKIARKEHVR